MRPLIATAAAVGLTLLAATPAVPQAAVPPAAGASSTVTGELDSGAQYVLEVPESWNGTLLVFSPGYIGGDGGGPAESAPSAATRSWLLAEGYALSGSQPPTAGWAVADLLRDQDDVVAVAAEHLGAPDRTIAWGTSMGGLTSAALLEVHPEVFDGALPLCGSVAGAVGMLNAGLDASFAFRTLLAPDNEAIELVDVDDEVGRAAAAREVLDAAQGSAAGRARIALAAAFAQLPTWTEPGTDRPGPRDWAAQQEQQYAAFMWSVFSPRQPLEARAGGNFSWNTGVDYREQLARSGNVRLVRALYRDAGLDLQADLDRLNATERIEADPDAVEYMLANATPSGDIADPVLTLHESGDTAPTVTQASAYADAVAASGNARLLRQAFVDRPGHCGYTAAETLAALTALEDRITTGRWGDLATSASLDARAARIDATSPIDLGTAEFARLRVDDFLRPYYPVRDR
ncbi:prolyl oligopeptidase family serine peptidase [Georgenia alba]|uniref:Prolyl oligopeptidase family serine peptidase n=1 Tax=Georgenia alba TaxID=2233858 RepID=A0ABW2Q867_9MICO